MEISSKEQNDKLLNLQAQYANYLKVKYFSDKDIYGGKIFEEKATTNGMTISASSEAGMESYVDPHAYWIKKYASSTESTAESTTNPSNGKPSSKKSA